MLKNGGGKNYVYLGIRKGYSIPTLPFSVEKFYNNNIFVIIFRLIGGRSFLMFVTKIYLNLPSNVHLLCAIIASIQITQIMIILIIIIKFFYGI